MRRLTATTILLAILGTACSAADEDPAEPGPEGPTNAAGDPVPTTALSASPAIHGVHSVRVAVLGDGAGGSYGLQVTNTGRADDSYRLALQPGEGGMVRPDRLDLASGETQTADIRIPPDLPERIAARGLTLVVLSRGTGRELTSVELIPAK